MSERQNRGGSGINKPIIIYYYYYYLSSMSDLQPSTAIANKSLGKSVSANQTITLQLHTCKAHYNILLTDYLIY